MARAVEAAAPTASFDRELRRCGSAAPDAEEQLRLGEPIATVRRAAEMRAVLIEELLQEAELTPEEQAEVREQITLQRQALSVIRAQQQAWETRTNG